VETNLTRRIKEHLLLFYRYERSMIAVQECMEMDVTVCDKDFTTFTEIEIKVSSSDLKNELKKPKHKRKQNCNYYYIIVPLSLKDEALEVAEKLNTNYGVMLFIDGVFPSIKTLKRAKKRTARQFLERAVINKLSSDYVKWYSKLQLYENDRLSNIPDMGNKATTIYKNLLRIYPRDIVEQFEYIADSDTLGYNGHVIQFLAKSVKLDKKQYTYSSKWIERVMDEVKIWIQTS
jgi:hypothetical protein